MWRPERRSRDPLGLRLATQQQLNLPIRVELDHHARHLIDNPDVVLRIDAHLLSNEKPVRSLADLAHEFPRAIELKQPRASVRERPRTPQ